MEPILDFLNSNAGVFATVFTFVVATSTVFYAYLTAKLVSETRKLRKAQTEPRVAIYVQSRDEFIGWIDLVVENIGLGPAFEIDFSLGELPNGYKNRILSDALFLKNGLRYFGPGQKMKIAFETMKENTEEKGKVSFTISVKYRDSLSALYSETFAIDLSMFRYLQQLGKPPLYSMSLSLKAITETLNKLLDKMESASIDPESHD